MSETVADGTIVKFNFGLGWKQITAAFAGMVAIIGAGGTAGWLAIPYANKTDVVRIEQHVEGIRRDVKDLQTISVDLADVVNELREAVAALKTGGGGQASPEVLPTAKPTGRAKKRDLVRPPDKWREGRRTRKQSPTKSAWQFPSFD